MLSRLFLLPMALTLASPTVSRRDDSDTTELLVRYHYESRSNQTEVSLSTPDKEDVYAHACDSTLDVAGTTVILNLNEKGSGTVTVDDKTYKAVGDSAFSGGASCTKLYDDGGIVVECLVPWPAGFENLSVVDNVEECFSEESAVRRRSLPQVFSPPLSARSEIEKRQGGYSGTGGSCSWSYLDHNELVGDGNPHQDQLHKQVGPSITCAQRGTCSVAAGEAKTIEISAEIGGEGGWISGGFSVSETKSSSTERGCEGEAGDTVCMWTGTWHTAYTVVTKTVGTCNSFRDESTSEPFVIRSPNDGMDTNWYCVLNTCRGAGHQWWELGRAGGP